MFNTCVRSASARPGTEILEVCDSQILRRSDRSPEIKFHPLSLRAVEQAPRDLCNFGSRRCTPLPCTNRPGAYQKFKMATTQNVRDKGTLIFYSYSKQM